VKVRTRDSGVTIVEMNILVVVKAYKRKQLNVYNRVGVNKLQDFYERVR
jgi:hypothetical protein